MTQRTIRIRARRRSSPDFKKLSRALLALAAAQAEADAEAQAAEQSPKPAAPRRSQRAG